MRFGALPALAVLGASLGKPHHLSSYDLSVNILPSAIPRSTLGPSVS